MKTCVRMLLVFLIIVPSFFFNASTSYAADETETEAACKPFFKDGDTEEKMGDFRDERASLDEEYALDLIELLLNTVKINTLEQLLFGNPFCIWFDGEEGETNTAYGLFPTTIKENVIDPFFNIATSIFALIFCLSVMISGLKMMFSATGGKRFNIGEEFFMYGATAVGFFCYWLGVDYLFLINDAIVTSIKDVLSAQGVTFGGFSIIAAADSLEFTDILILVTEWIIMLFLNLVYIYRLFIITVLLMLGGLAIVLLLFEKTRKYFGLWLRDFIGALFLQSVHALYFGIVILFINLDTIGFVFKMVLLFLFLPLSSMIMSLMGMSGSSIASKGAQSAVNSAGTMMRAKRMMGNKAGSKIPKMGDTTKISELAKGSTNWGRFKSGAQMAGSFIGGTAGSVIGGGGAMLGASAGGAFVGGVLQGPRNVTAGIKGIMDTRGKVKDGSLNLDNISDKRQYFGSMGESVGTMFGNGSIGRTVGHHMSGISKDRLLNSTALGGLGAVSLGDIISKFPEAKIQFQQTNEGSGFYLDEGGSMQMVSPVGESDPQLKDGMTRTVDFGAIDTSMAGGLSNGLMFNQVSDSMIQDTSGNSYVDNGFDSSAYTPEQHCNVGVVPEAMQPLNTASPY